MNVQVLGCSHRTAPVAFRERVAFCPEQVPVALAAVRSRFPQTEAVLLSTCNRVELHTASENGTREAELQRLLAKLPELAARAREEIRCSFDRLTNKLLHPPLESLRVESRSGMPGALLEAVTRLFQIKR